MLKLALILFIGLTNVPKITPCQSQWSQCGGLDYTGATDCCIPFTCTQLNPWYYQCLQGATTTTIATTTISTTTAPPNQGGCNSLYSQCGGQNWAQPTCCTDAVCVVQNPYYSQCLPSSNTQPTTTSTTAPTTTVSTTTVPTTTVPTTTVPTTTVPTTTVPSTTVPTTTAPTTTAPTTTVSTTTAPTTTAPPNQGGCNSLYSQCGGQNWAQSTCCTDAVCVVQNPYYSQCLPSSNAQPTTTSTIAPTTTISATTAPTTQPTNDNSQPGVTTRYWDCCKASCGWPGKAYVSNPVQSCQPDGVTPISVNAGSICASNDNSSMCNNQQPWNVNSTFSFGYAAANIGGQSESDWCCACYLLTFTSTSIAGKKLMVQVTNTGGDLGNNHFDLQMPGGGVGMFNGCIKQFPDTNSTAWGNQYGGISSRGQCAGLPSVLQSGCYWRFDWFENADNPSVTFKRVDCPHELTDNTQCRRL